MINYIIQVLLFQTVFLAVYDLILKKETFFQWNRAYLIISSILAYVIPLIRFFGVSESIPSEYRIMLPEVVLSPQTFIEKQVESTTVLFTGLQWLLIVGGMVAAVLFIYKIIQIIQLIRFNRKEKNKDYDLVLLPKQQSSFSFFRYIFLGNNLIEKEQIIAHELVHVKQKHSIDLLYFEIQKILLWFNPYSYIYQNRMAEVHEFIADAKTVNKKEKSTFYHSLLAETFSVDKLAFVNSYNKQSIIKKRMMMLAKNKSKEILKLKYLWLIPVLMGMLVYTSCENTETDTTFSKKNEKRLTKFVMAGYTDKEGKIVPEKVFHGEKEGFFDLYFAVTPPGKVILERNLSGDEKIEFEKFKENFQNPIIYEYENGNKGLYVQKISINNSSKKKDYSNADVVPFAAIDQVPVYPGCEDAKDQKKCLVEKITKFVNTNFNTGLSKNLGLQPGRKRVYVQFEIDKEGKIVDVRARGPHKDLEKEAVRVINKIPQMIPGEENGKKVGVKYTLPITLNVE